METLPQIQTGNPDDKHAFVSTLIGSSLWLLGLSTIPHQLGDGTQMLAMVAR
jgi:hypothetical protein